MKFEPDSVKEKNDRMNEFSEKLERLYEKLEALKNIKAARKNYYPRPPVGIAERGARAVRDLVVQAVEQDGAPEPKLLSSQKLPELPEAKPKRRKGTTVDTRKQVPRGDPVIVMNEGQRFARRVADCDGTEHTLQSRRLRYQFSQRCLWSC